MHSQTSVRARLRAFLQQTDRALHRRYRLIFAAFCVGAVAAAALIPIGASASQPGAMAHIAKKSKGLTTAQVIALIKQFAGTGPAGPAGSQGTAGQNGTNAVAGPPTGPAGGDLTGTYPNPSIANGAVTDAKVATANKDGLATVPSLRTLGTTAVQAMPGDAHPGGPPSGPANGAGSALAGTYPSPTLNVSGGPCANGQALTNISALAALTCSPGVFNSGTANTTFAVGSTPSGDFNSALGKLALNANTSGGDNTAVGHAALADNATAGALNSAFGKSALGHNTASNNTAVGFDALLANTTAGSNTAVGKGALATSTGGSNTALGDSALDSITSGASNTALGQGAGSSLTSGESNNIDIKNTGTTGESNTTRIGSTQTSAFLAGVSGINLGAVPGVVVSASGQLGVNASSERFKTDIQPLGPALDGLMELRPVSFRYKPGDVHGPNPTEFGLLAEQVAKVFPNLVSYGKDGKPFTVLYQQLPALLLAQAQRQQAQIEHQQSEIASQQAQINWLMHHR